MRNTYRSNKGKQENVPWSIDTTEDWIKDVAGWEWKLVGSKPPLHRWEKRGTCSRCGHLMDIRHSEITVGMHMVVHDPYVVGKCNCGEPHEGRPDIPGEQGCGFGAQFLKPKP